MSTSFAVVPRTDCPHISSLSLSLSSFSSETFSSQCQACPEASENWLCLSCNLIACSSYKNGHMSSHSESSSHEIVLSLIDLSIWCYQCQSYITSPNLSEFVRHLGELKHSQEPRSINDNLDDIRLDDLKKELDAAKNAKQMQGMYAITPKDDCPHVIQEFISEDPSIFQSITVNSECSDCGNIGENWICLKCGVVKCSRYIKEHMLYHALETSHLIALSFSDLSFWCYGCESYIVDLDLSEIYRIFSQKKFGDAKPGFYNSTAHVTEEEKQEFFDTEEELNEKIDTLAKWILESNYFVAFTGAGISTSAGIPDYRSGFNTVLPTGAGCWERKAATGIKKSKPKIRVNIEKALPTYTHMALYELMSRNYLKYVLSQNVDGLHRKSGIHPSKLAELHGNANVEKCKKCRKEYLRDFGVRNNPHVHMHETGNQCDDPSCRGDLIDTIINFGENLDYEVLNNCYEASNKADLCLAMGSSLRVNPAALFPKEISKHGRLVIINLQKTPLDKYGLKINALCDTVMVKLMQKFGLEVRKFKLSRRIAVKRVGKAVEVRGVDFNGDHYSFLTKVSFDGRVLDKEPFVEKSGFQWIELHFQGHYGEPALKLDIASRDVSEEERVIEIVYDPESGSWDS